MQPIYHVEGYLNFEIDVFDDKAIIRLKQSFGNVMQGEKTIYYANVSNVTLKKASFSGGTGYLQLMTSSTKEYKPGTNTASENVFLFQKGSQNKLMQEIAEYIKKRISVVQNDPTVQYPTEESLENENTLVNSGAPRRKGMPVIAVIGIIVGTAGLLTYLSNVTSSDTKLGSKNAKNTIETNYSKSSDDYSYTNYGNSGTQSNNQTKPADSGKKGAGVDYVVTNEYTYVDLLKCTHYIKVITAKRTGSFKESVVVTDNDGNIVGTMEDSISLVEGTSGFFDISDYSIEKSLDRDTLNFKYEIKREDPILSTPLNDCVEVEKYNSSGDYLYITVKQTKNVDLRTPIIQILAFEDGNLVTAEDTYAYDLDGVGTTEIVKIHLYKLEYDNVKIFVVGY